MKISKEDRIIGPCPFPIYVTEEEYNKLNEEGYSMTSYRITDQKIVIPDWLKGSRHTFRDDKKDKED